MIIQIAITALIAGLALTVVHLLAIWSNGGLYCLGRPPVSYIVGVATLGVPYIILLLLWGNRQAAVAWAVTVVVGGTPIIIGHAAKKFQILQKENEILRGGLRDHERRELVYLERQEAEAGRKTPGTGRVD